jgi:hypothetical protein
MGITAVPDQSHRGGKDWSAEVFSAPFGASFLALPTEGAAA